MSKELQLKSLNRLLIIMDELREKCPWDRKQTFDSLKPLTIEETYELVDAISENNIEEIKKGLKKTKGKYVFLLDSDDYFHKNKIREIIEIFNNSEKIQFVLNNPILKYKKREIKKNLH